MIVEEYLPFNSNLIRRYSDKGCFIKQEQTERQFTEAIDLINSGYTYIETNIPISEEEYSSRFSITGKIVELENIAESLISTNQELQENNNMLTECILEMSELLYE